MRDRSDTETDREARSLQMRLDNAQKAGFNETEKRAYLTQRVSLGRAKDFVQKGSQGKGFKLR